jgi:hypothetical protein
MLDHVERRPLVLWQTRHDSTCASMTHRPEGLGQGAVSVQEQLLVGPELAIGSSRTQLAHGTLVHDSVHTQVPLGCPPPEIGVEYVADEIVRVQTVDASTDEGPCLQPLPDLPGALADRVPK